MQRLAESRKRRDDQIQLARHEFNNVLVSASRAGVTAVDIRLATGLSLMTIRDILRRSQEGV